MDIQQLTERMHEFVRSKGWYEAGSKRPQTPRNLAASLSSKPPRSWNTSSGRSR